MNAAVRYLGRDPRSLLINVIFQSDNINFSSVFAHVDATSYRVLLNEQVVLDRFTFLFPDLN